MTEKLHGLSSPFPDTITVDPVIRKSAASAAVVTALANLDAKLTTDAVLTLNLQVTADKKRPAAVASAWLKSQGLI